MNTWIKHPLHPFITYKVIINILEVRGMGRVVSMRIAVQ